MQAADLGPVAPEAQTQPAFDLFLIFAGANIVATTLQVGASLAQSFGVTTALLLVVSGSAAGAALVASLAPIGSRFGVPSVIAARAALGRHGASLIALLLFLGNFAWIAINNVIAASACAELFGGLVPERAWTLVLGLLATLVVARGPKVVALADRYAVPLVVVTGAYFTYACVRMAGTFPAPTAASMPWLRGLDIVIGYQVSWLLMFADYSRYTASAVKSTWAVFLGLALTSIWLMPLGAIAASAAGTTDPGAMLRAVGIGASGALLLTLATLTTNFVNIYLSALAWKSLAPGSHDQSTVWTIGLVGTCLGLLSQGWLTRYADLMLVLGAILVPVGGVFFARFFLDSTPVSVPDLYERTPRSVPAFSAAGMLAWFAGVVVYYAASSIGSTLPSLLTAALTYVALRRMRLVS